MAAWPIKLSTMEVMIPLGGELNFRNASFTKLQERAVRQNESMDSRR